MERHILKGVSNGLSRSDFSVLQRQHFCHAASVTCGAAEVRLQKDSNQFQGEGGSNHLSTQAENVHVVVFDALMGGEDVVDKPSAHTRNFVCSDGRANTAVAKRHAALHFRRGNSPVQWDDEVGVVIRRVQFVCAEVDNIVPQGCSVL
jgi:hypothetical protein